MTALATKALADRLDARLGEMRLTPRAASIKAGLPVDGVRNILRAARADKPYHPRTDTIQKIAEALDTSPGWLLRGESDDRRDAKGCRDEETLTVTHSLLREAVLFVLCAEGVPEDQAELIADIFPSALAGPPIDAVDRDPFRSFQIHLQLQGQSAHRGP